MAELVRLELKTQDDAAECAARLAAAAPRVALPTHARVRVLRDAAALLEKDAESLAKLIVGEVKKPIRDARREVARAVGLLRLASEEASRLRGEVLPLDLDEASEGRWAIARRFPRGPALFITPFNFPLNLAAHKAGPAVAVGLPFALKPDPRAPRTAARLLQALVDAGWPAEAALLVSGPNPLVEALAADERLRVLSFTGSAAVGWKLKALAGKKHCVLELGGDAGVLVCSDADLAWAAARCVWGAYSYSGQVCISVQRIFVEKAVHAEFRKLLVANIKHLQCGSPDDESVDVGPMIDEASAVRVETWVREAMAGGAKLWAGGNRGGAFLPPALLEGVPADAKLATEEAFGPVAWIEEVDSRERGLDRLSAGRYGLQAGVFTNDLAFVQRAYARLPVGGVIVNDVPTWRSDAMPYGGVRDSGLGREGVRATMEEFTEVRTLVMNG